MKTINGSQPNYKPVMDLLQKAYNSGELIFKRSLIYRGRVAPKGHIFYIIKYDTQGKNVYFGAWKMNLDIESELLKEPGKLETYLCFKLAPVLTANN